MMDPIQELGPDDITPFSKIQNSWITLNETPKAKFRGLLVRSGDNKHFFFTSARDSFDEKRATAVMQFAAKHEREALAANPLVIIPGFKDPLGTFDAIAAVSPDVHRTWQVSSPSMTKATIVLYPIVRSELTGEEDVAQLRTMIGRTLFIGDWNREGSPITWMRFSNKKTGVKSTNKGFGFTTPEALYAAIDDLSKSGGFVEAKNFRDEKLRVERRDDALFVSVPDGDEQKMTKKATLELAKRFLTQGL